MSFDLSGVVLQLKTAQAPETLFAPANQYSLTNKNYVDTTTEPDLNNPSTDGFILSSTAAGVRSWIAPKNKIDDLDDVDTSTLTPVAGATLVFDGTNWVTTNPGPPPYVATTYDYTATASQTDFTVAAGSAGRSAEVYVDGAKLRSSEYDTSVDGVVTLSTAVAAGIWVQITI
jgi:hypothetical protein